MCPDSSTLGKAPNRDDESVTKFDERQVGCDEPAESRGEPSYARGTTSYVNRLALELCGRFQAGLETARIRSPLLLSCRLGASAGTDSVCHV